VLSKRAWCQQINEYLTERQIARDSQQKTKILFSYLCRAFSCHRPLCPRPPPPPLRPPPPTTTTRKAVSVRSTLFGLESRSESYSCSGVGAKKITTCPEAKLMTTTSPRLAPSPHLAPSPLDQSQEKPKGRVWGAISITKVFPFADVASPSPEEEALPQLS
jgi:hypothetical protein